MNKRISRIRRRSSKSQFIRNNESQENKNQKTRRNKYFSLYLSAFSQQNERVPVSHSQKRLEPSDEAGTARYHFLIVIFVSNSKAPSGCPRQRRAVVPRAPRAKFGPAAFLRRAESPAESLLESPLLFLMPGRIPRRAGDEIKRRECRVSKLARIYGALCNTAFLNSAI